MVLLQADFITSSISHSQTGYKQEEFNQAYNMKFAKQFGSKFFDKGSVSEWTEMHFIYICVLLI